MDPFRYVQSIQKIFGAFLEYCSLFGIGELRPHSDYENVEIKVLLPECHLKANRRVFCE